MSDVKKTYVLKRGIHVNPTGDRGYEILKAGQTCELTDKQYEKFSNKFEPVGANKVTESDVSEIIEATTGLNELKETLRQITIEDGYEDSVVKEAQKLIKANAKSVSGIEKLTNKINEFLDTLTGEEE